MATLQKIRSRGALLIIIIGLALFAFIAEEAFRSFQSSQNDNRQRIGAINGKHISAQEFQTIADEYAEAVKFTSNMNTLSDEQMTQVRDQAWDSYVSNQLIAAEAKKLGLTVTDAEMQDALAQGTNPLLAQTPFRNQKTGRFDVNELRNFLNQYETMISGKQSDVPEQYREQYQSIYKFWSFVEKTMREQILAQKYQVLLGQSLISNPIEAKMAFDGRTVESNILVAALPYTSIQDDAVKIDDSELKAKYDEEKEMFRQYAETRDIKFIDVTVTASDVDKKKLDDEMNGYRQRLANGDNVATVVHDSKSSQMYTDIPLSKSAFPNDIASMLDSIGSGEVKGPFYSQIDNSMNIVKVVEKVSLPDSVEYRQISVGNEDAEVAHKSADSIYNALKAGADFEAVAKKYGQTGAKMWLTSKQYEGSVIDAENANFLNKLNTTEVNGLTNISLSQGNAIIQVLSRKGMMTKYLAAVIKRPIQFSDDTYKQAYNEFSQFVAANPTLKDLEANAPKKGYRVQTREDFGSNEHYVGGVRGTREALKWVFDESTKPNDVSPLYDQIGDNDHLMVVAMTAVHKPGYRTWESVKDELKAEVLRDKKAAQLMDKLKSVKSIADAQKMPGAVSDTIGHVTFSAPAFVGVTNASEPALSGRVAKTAKGAFGGPVKGNAAVYTFQVLDKSKTADKYDAQKEMQQCANQNMRAASRFINELYQKADVKDNRYLFF